MLRNRILAIRLDQDERAIVWRLAQAERLPASTLARQLLLKEAERRGLLSSIVERQPQPSEEVYDD